MALFFMAGPPLAFYDDRIAAPPLGAVPITDDQHKALFDAQAQGQMITTGSDGEPMAVHGTGP